jgi:hypothetical protein
LETYSIQTKLFNVSTYNKLGRNREIEIFGKNQSGQKFKLNILHHEKFFRKTLKLTQKGLFPEHLWIKGSFFTDKNKNWFQLSGPFGLFFDDKPICPSEKK